jgi:hypothetical protein
MTVRMKVDGATGAVAIYDYAGHDLPLTDPQSHIPELYFHSGLDYPTVIRTVTGSITLDALPAHSNNVAAHTLFAHGRPGFPAIIGRITNLSATPVEFTGSVPVQMDTYGFSRWCTIGADEVNVLLHEMWCTYESAGLSAITLDYEIDILSILL